MEEDAIREGYAAERILNDPVFQKAIAAADEAFVSEWRRAETPQGRESAHALQKALARVVEELEILMGRRDFEEA